ncbi:hypothetical protein AB0I53_11760 [Saccharopolyspora sp. NPDC050389]|uniref:hypothetical protein n=1 Tax=Saccharopolyspora sp. NPDC050389 TaxID=3155516 RepID=UPI0033C8D06E
MHDAVARSYRDHHALIADAVAEAQWQDHAGQHTQQTELAGVEAKIAKTNGKIDRYLTAFENGTLNDELVGQRLAGLRATGKQLATRRDELAAALDAQPKTEDEHRRHRRPPTPEGHDHNGEPQARPH